MLALRAVRPRCSVSSLSGPSSVASASYATVRRKNKHKMGLTPQKRAALERAKLFAEGVDKSKADVKAATVNAPATAPASLSFAPELEELLALRPASVPRNFATETYAKKHQKLFEAIDSAFVRSQLMALVRQFPPVDGKVLRVASKEPKQKIIQRILDLWGWEAPRPKAAEAPSEKTQEFPITAAEVFLLKRDDKVAEWLNEMKKLKVDVVVDDRDPQKQQYLFTATGLPDTLIEIDRFLHSRRRAYARLEWTAMEMQGFEPSMATLGAIASVTGAFIEKTPKGTYIATGPTSNDVNRARGMVVMAANRSAIAPLPLFAALPSSEHVEPSFSLSPHFPAMTSQMPWDTAAAVSGNPLFRLIQSPAMGSPDVREVRQAAAALDSADVLPLSKPESGAASVSGHLSSMVSSVSSQVKPVDGGSPSVVIRLGHLLVPSTGTSVLQPPIKGSWPLDGQSPLAEMATPVFSPALPPALVQDPVPSTPSRVRKVTYRRAGAAERLVVSYEYAPLEAESASFTLPTASDDSGPDQPSWFLQLSDMLAKPQEDKPAKKETDDFELDMGGLKGLLGADMSATPPASEPAPLKLSFSVSTESAADILLPERPIDARILAQSTRTLPSDEVPHSLVAFFTDVHAHPSAARVPLSDIDTLRAGTGLPDATAVDNELFDDESWNAGEGEAYRLEDVLEDKYAEEDKERDIVASMEQPEKAPEPEAEPEPRPPPMPTATEGAVLTPPVTVLYAQEQWNLERDEVLDVSEWTRETTAEVTEEVTEATPPPPSTPVTTRSISVVDLRGPGGIVRFAELEAAPSQALYAELASVSRDVVLGRP